MLLLTNIALLAGMLAVFAWMTYDMIKGTFLNKISGVLIGLIIIVSIPFKIIGTICTYAEMLADAAIEKLK